MHGLFAYGTLMCEDIMKEAAGCYPSRCRGILTGWSRRPIKGEVYPAIIPDEKGRVEGVLYFGISTQALERLDRFEGEMYSRRYVEIRLPDETTLPAESYVLRPEFLHLVDGTEWDFDNFLIYHKKVFGEIITFSRFNKTPLREGGPPPILHPSKGVKVEAGGSFRDRHDIFEKTIREDIMT